MAKPTLLSGPVYIAPEPDIDTDMIFHNRHLHITDHAEMGRWIFGNLPAHKNFPQAVKPGTILIVGENFGCGSSRQQAVDGFIALGVAALIGESFGAIYKRNAINAGLPLVECPGILGCGLVNDDRIVLDLVKGSIMRDDGREIIACRPMPEVALDMYQAGGLLELGVR